jgi:Tol biopolymer transport system component
LLDGKGIVFTSYEYRTGKYEIGRMDINASLLKNLTGNLGGRAPAVSPPLVIPAN